MKFLSVVEKLSLDPSQIRPYLFRSSGVRTEVDEDNEILLASPFPIFSLEVEGKSISSTPSFLQDNDCIEAIVCEELDVGEYRFHYHTIRPNGMDVELFVSLTRHDIELVTVKQGKASPKITPDTSAESIEASYVSIANLVNTMLKSLHSKKLGSTRGDGRVKYKDASGKKVIYKPKDVIYISEIPRKSTKMPASSHTVNWKNAWEVSTHWRRLANPESLGKGRSGERNVKGFTYIGGYVKGEGKD